jgi:hypothetical protein
MCSQPQDIPALFRMRHHVEQNISVAFDTAIEAPATSNAGLPALGIVLFGMQGRMAEIGKQERKLLIKRPLDGSGRIAIWGISGIRVIFPYRVSYTRSKERFWF